MEPKSLVAAAALATLWFVEGLLPMFEGRKDRPRHDASNLVLGVGNALIASALFAGATLYVTEWARESQVGLLHWIQAPRGAALVLAIILMDLWQYWWHRLNHAIPLLWRFHAVHHADRELDVTSGLRFHTGEILLSSAARLAVLPFLGLTVAQVLVYESILLPIILFHHSNIRLGERSDRALRWLIVTPWMHWVHHSEYQPETDTNYSSVFSFWDRIFGSFKLVDDPRELNLGLEDLEVDEWRTLKGMLLMPFKGWGSRRPREPDGHGPSDPPST